MFEGIKKIHFVGIGGIGMSGIAEVLISYGYSVSGSDIKKESEIMKRLRKLGTRICVGHDAGNLKDAQAVVYSSAVSMDNPEVAEALRRKLPLISRGEMLSEIVRKGFTIAVSGAHGKTTTTAMIGRAIKDKKVNPTVILGGIFKGLSKNTLLGRGKVFVAEADESDGSFRKIRPNIAVITNMDREHMEYYGTLEKMNEAYLDFMSGVTFDGLVAVCGDDERLKRLSSKIGRRVVRWGLDDSNDLYAADIEMKGFETSFAVMRKKKRLGRARLNLAGVHNVQNSLAAFLVGLEMGTSFAALSKNLSEFRGVERRMEVKGEIGGITFVDDYAHHPTEISSTLLAARQVWNGRRFVVVFQPHRYSRLKDLMDCFPGSLCEADKVFVTGVYSAGESPIEGVSSQRLTELIRGNGKEADYIGDWKSSIGLVTKELQKGDVVFTVGAGDITKFFNNIETESKES